MVASSRGTARLIGIGMSCAASVAVGLGLVFKLVTPDSVAHLGTPELVGLLGLLVLPLGVLLLVRAHWPRGAAATQASAPLESRPRRVVVLAPDLRDNSGDRHRRRRHVRHVATARGIVGR